MPVLSYFIFSLYLLQLLRNPGWVFARCLCQSIESNAFIRNAHRNLTAIDHTEFELVFAPRKLEMYSDTTSQKANLDATNIPMSQGIQSALS